MDSMGLCLHPGGGEDGTTCNQVTSKAAYVSGINSVRKMSRANLSDRPAKFYHWQIVYLQSPTNSPGLV